MEIGNPQSFNRYAYVLNDPVNLMDPLGLNPFRTVVYMNGIALPEEMYGWAFNLWSVGAADIVPGGLSTWRGTNGVEYLAGTESPVSEYVAQLNNLWRNFPFPWHIQGAAGQSQMSQAPQTQGFDAPRADASETPIHCQPDVIAAMKRAWSRTQNGQSGNEAGFVLNGNPNKYQIVDTQSGNTKNSQKISINPGGPNRTFVLFHVHPNSGSRYPSTPNNNALNNGIGDTGIADKYNILFLIGHKTGLTAYDPKTNKTTDLRTNLDWLKPCK